MDEEFAPFWAHIMEQEFDKAAAALPREDKVEGRQTSMEMKLYLLYDASEGRGYAQQMLTQTEVTEANDLLRENGETRRWIPYIDEEAEAERRYFAGTEFELP
jgi:hypothetical protein